MLIANRIYRLPKHSDFMKRFTPFGCLENLQRSSESVSEVLVYDTFAVVFRGEYVSSVAMVVAIRMSDSI